MLQVQCSELLLWKQPMLQLLQPTQNDMQSSPIKSQSQKE
jgi:hypothetical protein